MAALSQSCHWDADPQAAMPSQPQPISVFLQIADKSEAEGATVREDRTEERASGCPLNLSSPERD